MSGIILSIIIGCAAGFLGSKIFKGASSGLPWNLIIGIVGGFIGGFLFGLIGIGDGSLIWELISATIGAVILLWIASKLHK
ncbi:MAG: GlsB/YeaQ/YmgE family stress response membrane protein [Paludibacteraceae bacterium]|nr:GlsB/YeaQ/YmgE family stress response membrane protein [Prevotellaceae bacterium]